MRPIDADALMDAMYHEAFETDSDRQKWDSGCWIRYKMFEEHIANAPTVGEWIPVSERLPEENGKYIASLEDSVYPEARFFNGKWFMRSLDGIAREFGEYEVIAWMPLPEPWKNGGE